MLMLLATTLAVASCHDPLVGEGDPDSLALSVVQQQTGLRLTYLCGNRFRIRTTRRDTVRVRWDVYRTADTGSVVVPGVEAPATQRDVVLETTVRGTTRIFLGGQLVDTKANGGTGCAESISVPDNPDYRVAEADFIAVDTTVGGTIDRYYRRLADVVVRTGTTDASLRETLSRLGAEIIFGAPSFRSYIIRLPDLGPSASAHKHRLEALQSEAVFQVVAPVLDQLPDFRSLGRFPDDSVGGIPRSAWFDPLDGRTAAFRLVNANRSWHCENGEYAQAASTGVGLLEVEIARNPDLASSLRAAFVGRSSTGGALSPSALTGHRDHASAVAGVLTARGDNSIGIAGVMWRTALHVGAAVTPAGRPLDLVEYFRTVVQPLLDARVRVINISVSLTWARPSQPRLVEAEYERWAQAVRGHPGTLFIVAVGQNVVDPSRRDFADVPSFASVNRDSSGETNAQAYFFSRIKKAGARNVLLVGGAETASGGTRAYGPGLWIHPSSGAGIDLVAPATDIMSLADAPSGTDVTTRRWNGTSFAAPMVAGAAAAALMIDPSLTSEELRALLIASARDSIVDQSTGALVQKRPVRDGIYMLDVYNLLRRVAARRPGLPICGTPVRTDAIAQQVIIGEGPAEVRVTVPALNGFTQLGTTLSVAPGGRRIAVNVFTDDFQLRPRELVLENGQWTLGPVRRDANAIAYADGDTVLFRTDPAAPWVVERRGRRPATRPLLDDFRRPVPDDVRLIGFLSSQSVDPSGRFVGSSVSWGNPDLACGTAAAGRVVAITHLDSDARDFVYDERFDPCVPPDPFPIDGGAIAWSGTGERGWFFARNIAGGIFSTAVSSVRRSGNRFAREGATRTIAQWLVDDARTSADGGTISTLEFGSEGGAVVGDAPSPIRSSSVGCRPVSTATTSSSCASSGGVRPPRCSGAVVSRWAPVADRRPVPPRRGGSARDRLVFTSCRPRLLAAPARPRTGGVAACAPPGSRLPSPPAA